MIKKRLLFAGAAILMAMSLVGCGGSGGYINESIATESATSDSYYGGDYDYDYDDMYDGYEAEMNNSMSSGEAGTISDGSNSTSNISKDKIITTFNYTIQTKQYDEFTAKVYSRIDEYGGYVESSEFSGDREWSTRNTTIKIRIPQDRSKEFLAMVEESATVTNMTSSTENVTLKYVDLESHIKTLRAEQDTLMALLDQAVSVDEIISLTDRITYVRYEIESYEQQLRALSDKVNYDTINMTIKEVKEEAVVKPLTYGEELSVGLADTFVNIGEGFRDFSLGFMINFPYILVFLIINGIIAGIVIAIVFGAIKANKKKKAKLIAKANTTATTVEAPVQQAPEIK